MSCYQSLVNSRFLANAPHEIARAKRNLTSGTGAVIENNVHVFDRNYRQENYYMVGNELGFFEGLYNINYDDRRIYYLNYENYLMVAARSKVLLDSAISAAQNVNGDVVLYRTKHTINKKIVHTVLFNTNFTIPPASLN
jgi:hypothetical protein